MTCCCHLQRLSLSANRTFANCTAHYTMLACRLLVCSPALRLCSRPAWQGWHQQQQQQQQQQLVRWRAHSSSESGSSAAAPPKPPPPKVFNVRPISKDDVEFSFARSGGAGGQNVNKVNTKVDMRFDLDKAAWIPEEVKEAVRRAEKNRFTKDGTLFITSTRHRTQSQNLDDCLAKLQAMLDAGVEAVTPKEVDPEVIKRVKANIKAGNERRLEAKKKDAKKKSERRRRDFD